jgi:hypothetical protein
MLDPVDARSRDRQREANVATCIECQTMSGLRWTGWRAYRVDDPELDEPPALALYCPRCARREFGPK